MRVEAGIVTMRDAAVKYCLQLSVFVLSLSIYSDLSRLSYSYHEHTDM